MPTEFAFRKNETYGTVTLPVLRGLKPTIDTAVVTFVVKDSDGNLIFADAPASIVGPALSNDGVTKRGTFSFSLASAVEATANDGIYIGYFKATHASGDIEVWPKHDSLRFRVTTDFEDLVEAPVSGGVLGDLQTQVANGFAVKDVVRVDSGVWSKAQANADATLGMGIVLAVPSTSQFRVAYFFPREVTVAAHGFGATGTRLYLSQATAGATVTSEPVSGISEWWGVVKDANKIILLNPEVKIV